MLDISYHFHFTPREMDEFTLREFEMYIRGVEQIRKEQEKEAQESRRG